MSTGPAALRGADAGERDLLGRTFAALCAIPSPSRSERAVVDHVLGLLASWGLEAEEDGAAAILGGTAGNVLCRIPAAGGEGPAGGPAATPTVLLCAHVDTVPVGAEIRPELGEDGVWRDALGGVLGADNEATVAAMLVVARRLAREPGPVAVELLLTVGEEEQLRGIRAFDASGLRAGTGYVVDHPTPIGGIVVGAPGHVRFTATFRGRAAHAAIAPEQGRSALRAAARAVLALPDGRLDDGSTVNVGAMEAGVPASVPMPAADPDPAGDAQGRLELEPAAGAVGGSAPAVPATTEVPTNVVPAHARLVGELRAPDEATMASLVDEVEALLHDAAHDPAGPVDLDLTVERRFSPYAHAPGGRLVARASAALGAIGVQPRPFADAGGSDANVLNAGGIPTIVLAGGNEGAHEAGERIAAADLERTLDLLLAVLREEGRGVAG